ncbi:MAG: YhdP family protein [Pseudomonadota bacterium]|nr:YhdP family protein [Pseudomonadota bacterium]
MMRRLTRYGIYLGLVLAVIVSLAAGTLALLSPELPQYRQQLEQWLEARTGREIEIDELIARWHGFGPEIAVSRIQTDDAEGLSRLRVGEVSVGFNLFDLLRLRAQPNRVVVEQADLELARGADGRWRLEGIPLGAGGNAGESPLWGDIADVLETYGTLVLRDSTISVSLAPDRPPGLVFRGLDISLHSSGRRHRLQISSAEAGRLGRDLHLSLDARGDLHRPERWSGTLSLGFSGLTPGRFLQRLAGPRLVLEQSDLNLLLDSRWQEGRLVQAEGELALRRARLLGEAAADGSAGADSPEAMPLALQLDYGLAATDGDYRVRLTQIAAELDSRTVVRHGELEATLGHAAHPVSARARAETVRLQPLVAVLDALVPARSSPPPATLAAFAPEGTVTALDVRWENAGGLRGTAGLHGVGWQPVGDLPGVAGLDGELQLRGESGEIHIDSEALRLAIPRVFPSAWPAARTRARLAWQMEPATRFELDVAQYASEDGSLSGQASLQLAEATPPWLEVQAEGVDIDLARLERYLPQVRLPAGVRRYLVGALSAGTVRRAQVELAGPVNRFPADAPDGYLRAQVELAEALFAFDPRWPALERADALLRFEGRGLEVALQRGQIMEAQVQQASARIADLTRGELQVEGQLTADVAAAAELLRRSPLARGRERLLRGLDGSGPTRVALNLTLPLRALDRRHVAGQVQWQQAQLRQDDWDLTIDEVSGTLAFENTRFSADDLRGRLYGEPVRVDVAALPGQDRATRISARGTLSARQLRQRLPALAAAPLQGQSTWRGHVDLLPRGQWGWQLNSDLAGMALDWPAPLGKAPAPARPLEIASLGEPMTLRFDYGDRLAGRLRLGEQGERLGFDRGDVIIGTGASSRHASLPHDPGLRLRGGLSRVDLPAWLAQLPAREAANTPLRWPAWLQTLDVTVDDIVGLPVPLKDLALQVTGDAGSARAQFSSSLAAGALDVPASPHEPWQGRLDYLRLPARARSEPPGEAPQQASAPALSPADLPALQLAIEQLYTGDGLLGSAELRLAPTPQGVALRRLRLHGPAVELTASGSWTRTAEGDSTQLELASRSGAIARFMRTLGQAVPLEAEHSEATLAAQWPAAPWGFDATRARGRLSLTLTDGYIYAAEDTSDAMMLLFSLYALPRRLNEDLGDIFRSSMAFDQIDGSFRLAQGVLQTERLRLDGPAADITVAGHTDMVRRELHQRIEVTPDVSAGIALAGAVAAGPAVGAALWLGQRLLRPPLGELVSLQYRLEGDWRQPRLTRIGSDQGVP